ncbi:MAG: TonB C-terminal domain-containing protein [Mariprofundus sp.]|nr:TonB C-terminal domain-containing protein [Mariprofundus sp.]
MKKFNINIFKPQQRRFSIALLASLAVHILLAVLIVSTTHDKPLPKKEMPQIMDVVLLDEAKKASKKANKDARTIANKNAIGSSRNARDRLTRKAKTPMSGKPHKPTPVPKKPVAKAKPKAAPEKIKKAPASLIAKRNAKAVYKKTPKKPQPKAKSKPKAVQRKPIKPRKLVPLSNLMPSAMALSQLSRDFERERRMKQNLSREADIPINTKQAKYAPYAHGLVRALEEQWRPGNADYEEFAESARRSLIKLTIERDGSLGGIEILRPSPIPEINESAIKAIQAAAPFKVLPSSWGLDRVSFYLTFEVVENGFVFRSM